MQCARSSAKSAKVPIGDARCGRIVLHFFDAFVALAEFFFDRRLARQEADIIFVEAGVDQRLDGLVQIGDIVKNRDGLNYIRVRVTSASMAPDGVTCRT